MEGQNATHQSAGKMIIRLVIFMQYPVHFSKRRAHFQTNLLFRMKRQLG